MHRYPLLVAALVAVLNACHKDAPPPEDPTKVEKIETAPKEKAKVPAIEYDLGPVDPYTWKQKVAVLKGQWSDCYQGAAKKNPTLEGKLTFTFRTSKDGNVKWAYIKESSLGDRAVERCVLDTVRSQNYGPPMDAREGEMAAHSMGWQPDGDDYRAADAGPPNTVLPAIQGAKGKLSACRSKAGSKGLMIATIYVGKGGKPIAAGLAVTDAEGEAAADCVAETLMSLKYVNKSSWTTKVTVELP